MNRIELMKMWEADAVIHGEHLKNEAITVSKLHAKYLGLLMQFKLQMRKAESEYLNMRRCKRLWYRGKLPQEDLQKLGWPQYLGKEVLKGEMEHVLEEDEDLLKKQDVYEYMKNMVYAVEMIMKSISSRGWDIKNSIEMVKFESGE